MQKLREDFKTIDEVLLNDPLVNNAIRAGLPLKEVIVLLVNEKNHLLNNAIQQALLSPPPKMLRTNKDGAYVTVDTWEPKKDE